VLEGGSLPGLSASKAAKALDCLILVIGDVSAGAAILPGRDSPAKIAHVKQTIETAQANYGQAALESVKGNITDEQLEQAERRSSD
jgi:hypothetical protein